MSDEEEKGALPGGLNMMLHVMGKRWSLTGERDDRSSFGRRIPGARTSHWGPVQKEKYSKPAKMSAAKDTEI